jgi:toxin-antitoxin system PIN domain toxin
MAALPDVNVLLALIYGAHAQHARALAWMNAVERDGEVMLCRVSQLGLLRLLNNPVALGPDAQSGAGVWVTWDALVGDPRFRFVGEPPGLQPHLRRVTTRFNHQPGRWQDAYLAAFALAADLQLVTFDPAFRAVPRLRHRILGE